MRHNNSKTIFSYWNNLRGNRKAPDRREIEPSDIRHLLGDTFILEMDEQYRTISFRLAGTRICNAYGRELKGLGFLAIWDETDNLKILNAVRKVYEESTPCTASFVGESEGKRFAEYEITLLPLNSAGNGSKRILGTASALTTENWLGSDPLVNNRLKSIRFLDVNQYEQTPSLATPFQIPSQPANKHGKRYGHLTLIEGGAG